MGPQSAATLEGITNKDIAKLLAAIACNAFTLTDECMDAIGIAMFPYAAMANHACRCAIAESGSERLQMHCNPDQCWSHCHTVRKNTDSRPHVPVCHPSVLHIRSFHIEHEVASIALQRSNPRNRCRPNCFAHCEAGALRLRALRDIETDAELTISYMPLDVAFMQRRNALQASYFFDVAPSVRCTAVVPS